MSSRFRHRVRAPHSECHLPSVVFNALVPRGTGLLAEVQMRHAFVDAEDAGKPPTVRRGVAPHLAAEAA